jgi:hypothetical protein
VVKKVLGEDLPIEVDFQGRLDIGLGPAARHK